MKKRTPTRMNNVWFAHSGTKGMKWYGGQYNRLTDENGRYIDPEDVPVDGVRKNGETVTRGTGEAYGDENVAKKNHEARVEKNKQLKEKYTKEYSGEYWDAKRKEAALGADEKRKKEHAKSTASAKNMYISRQVNRRNGESNDSRWEQYTADRKADMEYRKYLKDQKIYEAAQEKICKTVERMNNKLAEKQDQERYRRNRKTNGKYSTKDY